MVSKNDGVESPQNTHQAFEWGDTITDQTIVPQTVESGDLVNLDEFRADARSSGNIGSVYSVVVIDTGIDLDHRAFGPDADGNGVSDRIVYHETFHSIMTAQPMMWMAMALMSPPS